MFLFKKEKRKSTHIPQFVYDMYVLSLYKLKHAHNVLYFFLHSLCLGTHIDKQIKCFYVLCFSVDICMRNVCC